MNPDSYNVEMIYNLNALINPNIKEFSIFIYNTLYIKTYLLIFID